VLRSLLMTQLPKATKRTCWGCRVSRVCCQHSRSDHIDSVCLARNVNHACSYCWGRAAISSSWGCRHHQTRQMPMLTDSQWQQHNCCPSVHYLQTVGLFLPVGSVHGCCAISTTRHGPGCVQLRRVCGNGDSLSSWPCECTRSMDC